MADLDAALVQQFLDITVAQRKEMVEPNCVLEDGHGETVAVRVGVGHVGSAYPSPIKATQPTALFRYRSMDAGRNVHQGWSLA